MACTQTAPTASSYVLYLHNPPYTIGTMRSVVCDTLYIDYTHGSTNISQTCTVVVDQPNTVAAQWLPDAFCEGITLEL